MCVRVFFSFAFALAYVVALVCVFLFTLAHNCSLLRTIVFTLACVSLFYSHLHVVALALVYMSFLPLLVHGCFRLCLLWLFPPTHGHSSLVTTPRLLLFLTCYYSPLVVVPCISLLPIVVPCLLLFFTRCWSPPIVAFDTTFHFFKVPLAPLLSLLLLAHCYSLFVFPHMVLPPPSSPFTGSFWSNKQQAKTNEQ